jgi:hypothetical protein
MKVEIFDYGSDETNYYVVYKVTELNLDEEMRLKGNVEGDVDIKNDEMYITTHFEEKYYPFGSDAAKCRIEDFIAREEIEMTVYLTSVLEDE